MTYRCDTCNAILSEGGEGVKHLSLAFGKRSGWVDKVEVPCHDENGWTGKAKWRITGEVSGIKQFCGISCLAQYFEKMEG